MRKLTGNLKAWSRFRNVSPANLFHTSPATVLNAEQVPLALDLISYQRRFRQSLQHNFSGEIGPGLWTDQCRTKCSSVVQFSRSYCVSKQSLRFLLPISVSVSTSEQPILDNVSHADNLANRKVPLFKVRENPGLAVVSEHFNRDKHRNQSEGSVHHASQSPSWFWASGSNCSDIKREDESSSLVCATPKNAIVHGAASSWNLELAFQAKNTIERGAGSAVTRDRKDERGKCFRSHIGNYVNILRIQEHKKWDKRRSQYAERVRPLNLQLERQQGGIRPHAVGLQMFNNVMTRPSSYSRLYSSDATQQVAPKAKVVDHSQRAVVVALWCNFLVLALKVGVWFMTSSHVMLAEAVHSLADLANQGLLAYGLISSRRAPDALHPYGYSRERFVWSLISAVGIFCLGCGATIVHGVQNLWSAEPLANIMIAASVIAGSMLMEGASFVVAYVAVKKGAAAEGMTLREYLWRGHDPTSVAVLMEDGAAVAGLAIAGIALATAEITGNPMWDPIGSILVGNLLGVVAIFLIQRNRQALLGRSIDDVEMRRIINLLIADPVVEGLYDCKSEIIGPGEYRFKAEIDFNGVVIVQNYLQRAGRDTWMAEFRKAVNNPDGSVLDRVLAEYGEEVVSAVGCEVDRLEKDIQKLVPGIRHVDIESHNPNGPAPREKFYLY